MYEQMSKLIEFDAQEEDDLGRREAEVVCFQAAFEGNGVQWADFRGGILTSN